MLQYSFENDSTQKATESRKWWIFIYERDRHKYKYLKRPEIRKCQIYNYSYTSTEKSWL